MPNVRKQFTNFARGELSPLMSERYDTVVYRDGAATLTNSSILIHGGVRRRPGSRYLADTGLASAACRLEAFVFSPGQAYVLCFSNTQLQVYGPTGTLLQTLTSMPWTSAMLPDISVAQSADTMILVHSSMKPQTIRRTGVSSFVVADFAFDTGAPSKPPTKCPFYKFAASLLTIQPSAFTGAGITVTASAAAFTAATVGSILRYAGTEMVVTGYTDATHVTATCSETLARTVSYPVVSSEGFLLGDLVQSTNGEAQGVVTAIPDATHVQCVMLNRAQAFEYDATVIRYLVTGTTKAKLTGAGVAAGSPDACVEWDENAFSVARGYPSSVCFHDQRLVFGGSQQMPDHLFLSAVADYFDFDVASSSPADAIVVQLATTAINRINHVVSHRHLLVFCDGAEMWVPQGDSTPLTPTTISVRAQTRYGCGSVTPRPFDGSTLFVQAGGQAVREFIYTDTELSYSANPVSMMSEHLIVSPVDMDVIYGSNDFSEQYAFVVNSDGTLAQYHSVRKEQLQGWTPWVTDGSYVAVRAIDKQVYFLVRRTVNGATRTYLEIMDPSVTLDCAKAFAGAATTTYAVPHLAGKAVVQGVDGVSYYGGAAADASGTVVLPFGTAAVTLGLDFTRQLINMPIATEPGGGALQGGRMRVVKASVWLDQSVSVSVDGYALSLRQTTDDLSLAPTPKTGLQEIYLLGWSKTGQVTLDQAYPLPLAVLGMTLEVAI